VDISARQYWAVRSLAADATTAELARAFANAQIRWMLLKGPSIALRLYTDGAQRPYSDVDALVHPDDVERAETTLEALRYERIPYSTRREQEHASPWRRQRGAEVDLHRTFAHIPAEPRSAWSALSRDATTLRVAGEDVAVPSAPALALLVALHALHHAGTSTKPTADLERACRVLTRSDWDAARALAVELRAERNLAAALTLSPAAAELSSALGLPKLRRWEVTLRSGEYARLAAAVGGLGKEKGVRGRVAALYRAVVPDREVTDVELRPNYDGASRAAILIRRMGRSALKLPVALVAWWVHRRDAHG
jgi:hypothetical protein